MSALESKERARYVTLYHQLKDTETGESGDRFIVHGEYYGDRHIYDDDLEDFVPVARPIAVIDVGAEIGDDDLSAWCNSHAGKAVLSPYFPGIEPDDPTLPDSEEYLEGSR